MKQRSKFPLFLFVHCMYLLLILHSMQVRFVTAARHTTINVGVWTRQNIQALLDTAPSDAADPSPLKSLNAVHTGASSGRRRACLYFTQVPPPPELNEVKKAEEMKLLKDVEGACRQTGGAEKEFFGLGLCCASQLFFCTSYAQYTLTARL